MKREDGLDQFIRENRASFDDKEPSEKAWAGIDRGIRASSGWWSSVAVWRAAAVLFMALSGYLLIPTTLSETQRRVAMREFRDVEAYYTRQISERVELIDELESSEGVNLNGFTRDFQQLEAMYLVLKEEMKARPSQKVKDALVLNLLVQIDLLNQHLHKLEQEKSSDEAAEEPGKRNI